MHVLPGQLQRNEILAVFKVRVVRVGSEKLCNFVRVNVVRVSRILVARNVIHGIILLLSHLVAKDACPFAMEKFTTFGLTSARVAESRAFEYVSLRALGAFAAVAAIPKILADRCTGQGRRVGILAVGIGAVALGKM